MRTGTPRGSLSLPARCLAAIALLALGLCDDPVRGADTEAVSLHVEIALHRADLRVRACGVGTAVELSGGVLSGRPGEPALPALSRGIELPPAMVATGLRVSALETDTLSVGDIIPVDRPVIPAFGISATPAPRDEEIYGSTEPFPAALAELEGTAWTAGRPIAMLRLFPLQYVPRARRLLVHTRIAVEVLCEPAPATSVPRGGAGDRAVRASWLLSGPTPGAPAAPLAATGGPTDAASTPLAEDVDPALRRYLIITTESLAPAFEPLAAWKTRKGVPAAVVTVDEIAAACPDGDAATRLREYLRSAYTAEGTLYALLAGPPTEVGFRYAYAMDSGVESQTANTIPADLYFADLDGDWNADQDSVYGETSDEVDLLPEIYVGRVLPRTLEEAEGWVAKVLAYEQNPPRDYQTQVLMLGEISFSDPYTDDGIGLDRIDDLYFGPEYDPITKLYESQGNENRTAVLQALNDGPHLVLHCGHGHYTSISVGEGSIRTADAEDLTNGERSFLLYSVGCLAAAFDQRETVLGELLLHPAGGAYAAIGNTRYGWASPGNPGYGYSEVFMQAFIRELVTAGVVQAGVALAQAKAGMAPFSGEENIYRWHQYCVNLLGDPELPIYTRVPPALAITAPGWIPPGDAAFEALVTDGSGPVEGATLCLAGEGGAFYQVGVSGADGRLGFAVQTGAATFATLTATAPRRVAAALALEVGAPAGPVLALAALEIDDDDEGSSSGNDDGEVNAGEKVELWITLRNLGGAVAESVRVALDSLPGGFGVLDGEARVGTIAAGGSTRAGDPIVLSVGPDLSGGDGTALPLAITAAGGGAWAATGGVAVRAAEPYMAACHAVEVGGDGDGLLEAGEQALLELELGNRGNGTLGGAFVILLSRDPFVTVCDPVSLYRGGLAGGDVVRLEEELLVRVDSTCPAAGHNAALEISLFTGERSWVLPFTLLVGAAGFEDDLESGTAAWDGVGQPWHVTTHRARSGAASWHCGDEETHSYANDLDAALVSRALLCPPQGELRLWRSFDVATYGSDGLYIEVCADTGATPSWTALDYIGSGGALGPLAIRCDWDELVYPLDFTPGTPIRVRFRFVSDAEDGGEGFYIDDVRVVTGDPYDGPQIESGTVWPNPFAERAFVRFDLPAASAARLDVFDLSGRIVRTLYRGDLPAGNFRFLWDGADRRGERVPCGLYFLRLEAGAQARTWRVMHVR